MCGAHAEPNAQRAPSPPSRCRRRPRPRAACPSVASSASSIVVSSNGRSPASTASSCSRSTPSVQVPIRTVATALPAKFVSARASDMNRSMPTIRPTPSSSSGRCEARPPARVARPAPVTPAAPLEAMTMKTSSEICSPIASGLPERLGDEQRRHRQVDRGAVEVERVAGRDDDADGRPVDARRAPSSPSAAAAPTPRTRSRGSAGTRGRGTSAG